MKRLSKQFNQVIEYADGNGWRYEKTKNGHIKFLKGKDIIFASSTPSCHRAHLNCLSDLRRADRLH